MSTPANISIPIIIHGEFAWYHRGGNLNKLKFWHWISKGGKPHTCMLDKFKNMAGFKLRHCYCNIVDNVYEICKKINVSEKQFKEIQEHYIHPLSAMQSLTN